MCATAIMEDSAHVYFLKASNQDAAFSPPSSWLAFSAFSACWCFIPWRSTEGPKCLFCP